MAYYDLAADHDGRPELFIRFVYTPADDPKISVAVVLEAGAWGAEDSGPIARKILDQWVVDEGGQRPTDPGPGQVVTADTVPEAEAAEASSAQDVAPAAAGSTAPPSDNGEDQ